MGLFGLFYAGFVGIAKMYKSINNDAIDMKIRSDAKNTNKEHYIGADNELHLTKDGKKIMYTTEYTRGVKNEGDKVLKYVDSGEIIKNYSKDIREKRENEAYNEAIKKGYSTYRLGGSCENYNRNECKGYRFKDINNGKIYVIRLVNDEDYYMDIETSLLVRHTDEFLERLKIYKETGHIRYQAYLINKKLNTFEFFNTQQLEYIKKYGKKNYRNSLDAKDPRMCL